MQDALIRKSDWVTNKNRYVRLQGWHWSWTTNRVGWTVGCSPFYTTKRSPGMHGPDLEIKSRIMAVLEGQSNSTETGADLPTQKNNWFTARSCIFQYHRLTVFAMGSSGTLRKHFSTLQHLRGNGQLGEETEQNWQERIAISTRCDRSFLIGGKNASSNCIDLDITYHSRNKWMRK